MSPTTHFRTKCYSDIVPQDHLTIHAATSIHCANRQGETPLRFITIRVPYTERLDFSDSTPVDITIEGVFGMSDNDGNITLEQQG